MYAENFYTQNFAQANKNTPGVEILYATYKRGLEYKSFCNLFCRNIKKLKVL